MTAAQKHYPDADSNPDFAKIEERVLAAWKKEGTFAASVKEREAVKKGANNEFIFYDGPPFANGLPHYGHLLTGFVKDLFARYQTMRGHRVERRFGWDCHGLPAEMGAEKDLGISGHQAIVKYGIGKFNDYCRTSVMKYTHEWEYYVTRQARWVDFANDYKTMDKNYMESVIWAFKQLYDKGLIYEAYRVMPYSWAAETPLSNFETRLDNSYRERVDKAITVAFELKDKPKGAPDAEKYYVLAWTTTPWTLPSNLALAVSRNVKYGCVVADRPPLEGGQASIASRGGYSEDTLEKAKELRKNPTEAESKLWYHLQQKNAGGFKFRRQQPIGNYIADFYCTSTRLIIEVDGSQHAEQTKYDARRTAFFEQSGYRVLRFWNNEVLQQTESVLQRIFDVLNTPHDSAAASGLASSAPPQGGSEKVCYILASGAVGKYELFNFIPESRTRSGDVCAIHSENLLGLSYKPLFPYFKDHKDSFRILDGSDFVTDAEGTGIVHLAPGFGEDDQRVCEAAGIELVCPVDQAGRFTDEIYDLPDLQLKGLNVIEEKVEKFKFGEANELITKWLKQHKRLIGNPDQIKHNYPHCWRTDKPLIYKAVPSWYVEVTKFRGRMVELNRQINWIPAHVRDGLFGKWLENARDWSISRKRFWGTPIPVWKSKSGKIKVFGSIAELEKVSGRKIADLHRPFIDEIVISEDGEEYRRVEDVFDCRSSGSMPYAQVHYPFENKDWFDGHFPADFIVEYVAQTRGWFYTLMVLGTALFDKPPFKNCICHGVVLDDKGQKLSKRLNNYADPKVIFDQYGADALRWFMMSSGVMRGSELHIDKEGKFIRDVVRLAIKPIWNAYSFFCLYANADDLKAEFNINSRDVMDRYILAKCRQATETIAKALDEYDTPQATEAVTQFFEALNNWYIRRNKERFWKEAKDGDKRAAYNTLYSVLVVMCRASAPLLPLVCEEIYQGLTGEKSVHLTNWPDVSAFPEDDKLMQLMDMVRDIAATAHAIRNHVNIRVRQPLSTLQVVGAAAANIGLNPEFGIEEMLKDEVNVKEITRAEVKDIVRYADYRPQINFAVLGKRLPEKIKHIIPAAKNGEWNAVGGKLEIAGAVLEKTEFSILLEPKPEYKDRAGALASNDTLVILDTEITPELEAEGFARDLVRLIQQARKDAGLHVTDRIHLRLRLSEKIRDAMRAHRDYIAEQVLAESLTEGDMQGCTYIANETIENEAVSIGISSKAAAA